MELQSWIDTWRGPLTGLLLARGASAADAAELAQDALVEGWLGRERLEGQLTDERSAGPWLAGIARNLLAARRRRAWMSLDAMDEQPDVVAEVSPEDPRLALLRDELGRLPPNEREALSMFYLEQTSMRAVAALLEVSEKTVENRLYRGRRLLRERIAAAADAHGGPAR